MKSLAIILSSLAVTTTSYAQNVFPLPSGNVGIGTTSPSERLTIIGGDLGMCGASTYNWAIHSATDGNWGFGVYNLGANYYTEAKFYGVGDNARGFRLVDVGQGTTPFFVGGSGNVGIGTSNPTEKLQIAGNVSMLIDGCVFDMEKSVRTYPWNFSSRPAGWYRIGTNVGNRANATFELRDEADHSTLKFVVGCSYNAIGGAAVTVLSHNVYCAAVFKKIRLLTKTTYDAQYLEVYIDPHNNDNLAFFAIVRDNLRDGGWNLNNYDSGNVPAGYTSTEYNVDDLFLVAGAGDEKSFRVDRNGSVGIGTTNPTEKLSVKGKIRAQEVIVEMTGWSDHVFAKDYRLAPLSEVEQHIEQQGHLPGVPSAQEVAAKGVSVGDMQAILLAKIEELTLHQIAQEKKQTAQEQELATQRNQLAAATAKIDAQQAEIVRLTTQTK